MGKTNSLIIVACISILMGQEINWLDYPDRTAVRIYTDEKGLPIYIDGLLVGTSHIETPIDVTPGWHRISYFPDSENPYTAILPKDRRVSDIIRMGTVKVLVEKGQVVDVTLNYQSIDDEVRMYRQSVHASRWIGLAMVITLVGILTWVL